MRLNHDEIRDRFHLELGRLVHASSRFDFNVGIALGELGPHHGENVSDLLIARKPLAQRLERLKPLVMKTYLATGVVAQTEFAAWFQRAEELKAIRNDYGHARWGIPGHSESDDPILKMLPMNWNFSPEHPDASVDVTLSSLAELARAIERISAEYGELRKKYIAYAAPAKTLPWR